MKWIGNPLLPRSIWVDIEVIHMIQWTRPSPLFMCAVSEQKLDSRKPGNEATASLPFLKDSDFFIMPYFFVLFHSSVHFLTINSDL